MIDGEGTENDLEAIREAFSAVHVFGVPKTRNLIAIAPRSGSQLSYEALVERAEDLDRQLDVGLSFVSMVKKLR